MSNSYRRYEMLLPVKFNDGQPIPDELMGVTLRELRSRFGAISLETQTIQGTWSFSGQEYRDELVRVFVDVKDDEDARQFFQEFKQRIKERFGQLDIWITTHPVDVI